MNKVVLAYSGGLDTSVIIPWLREKYGSHLEIICYAAHLGQRQDFEILKKKALSSGASQVYVDDLREEFVADYIFPSLKAGALYEGKYPLATALGRPLIAKEMIKIARKENADALCHGCTAKGNDQIRFDVTFTTLAPELQIIAPLREWTMKSREEEIEYAKKYNIPIPVTKETPYSLDENLWGQSIECGVLEDPWVQPPEDAYVMTSSLEEAPDEPDILEISFEKGIPIAIDGEKKSSIALIEELSLLGSKHCVGRIDMVENRLIGIKSREIYESPAATILFEAHKDLETLTVERDLLNRKRNLAQDYAQIVYYGQWFSPLREALDAFVLASQSWVTGTVRLKIYKGNVLVIGRKSPFSLYDESLSTYTEKDSFDHRCASGFIRAFSLPLKVVGRRNQKQKNH